MYKMSNGSSTVLPVSSAFSSLRKSSECESLMISCTSINTAVVKCGMERIKKIVLVAEIRQDILRYLASFDHIILRLAVGETAAVSILMTSSAHFAGLKH